MGKIRDIPIQLQKPSRLEWFMHSVSMENKPEQPIQEKKTVIKIMRSFFH